MKLLDITRTLVSRTMKAKTQGVGATLLLAILAGCSGGGADTVDNPVTSLPPDTGYSGPPPATADVQAFKLNVWDNISPSNRCGACHIVGGTGVGAFARNDDINLAYEEANSIVDLSDPDESFMVTKVGGGHNCWLSSNDACSDILTTWIEGWAGDALGEGGRAIELEAPIITDVGNSRNFPADSGIFSTTVYPVLTQYCADCHSSSAQIPQTPYFADADVDLAYDAARSKIDLNEPSNSRFVLRLRNEFHNCWSDCQANANTMQTEVERFANQVPLTEIDPSLLVSKALTLYGGTAASGGNRFENSQIALWEFKTGQGTTAFDTSGVEPGIDLTLSGDDVEWFGGFGLNVKSGKAQGSTAASKKLHDMITSTGEYTVEAWVVPGNVNQEDVPIISYSAGNTARNFTLGQTLYQYDFFNRSSVTDGNGQPQTTTNADDEDLQATLQHVVATYDPVNGRTVYVNGVFTDDVDDLGGGTLNDWDDTFAFVIGNEVSGDRQWEGIFRLVAVHNRALTPEQITQNFDAGVGEKFFLLFSVADWVTSVPEPYVLFEVSQFDSYSYLFNEPHFISLDPTADISGVPIQALRIGVNGAESPVGQAYKNLDMTTDAANETDFGEPLSSLGTVVSLEKGPELDEFFLTFEVIGSGTNVRTEPSPLIPPITLPTDPMPTIGVRTFDEINATMSTVTGISMQHPDVVTTYSLVRQQLPVNETIDGFSSSHQIGVAQMAIEYCNALVEDGGLRSSYFPGFNFNGTVTASLNAAGRDLLIDPLLDNVFGVGLTSQPDPVAAKAELNSLIDRLTVCGGSCASDRTETVAKAVCSAAIGSAGMLVQ